MRDGEHSVASLLKRPVGTVMTALIGLAVAAFSLLLFVLDLLATSEIGINDLIVSFVVCGMGLATGLFLLRSLVFRREPISLFAGAVGLSVQPTARAEVRAQTVGCLPDGIKSVKPVHGNAVINPVMKSHGSESIATYKTHDGVGALGLVTILGLGSGLTTFFSDGWQFLSLTVLAGCTLALVLYWRRGSGISQYRIPATGGVIGLIAIIGIGVIMMRFPFLRVFWGLAMGAGGAVALVLHRDRKENPRGSFIRLRAESGSFSRTMRIE